MQWSKCDDRRGIAGCMRIRTGEVQQRVFAGTGGRTKVQRPCIDSGVSAIDLRLLVGAHNPNVSGRSGISFQSIGDVDHDAERRAKTHGVLLRHAAEFIDAGLNSLETFAFSLRIAILRAHPC